jgi:hypothetical protein
VSRLELVAVTEGDRPLHQVLQLADVPGEPVGSQRLQKSLADLRRAAIQAGRVPLHEPGGEEIHVSGALPERGEEQAKGFEPVVEVLANLGLAALVVGCQFAMRGGNDAHVDRRVPVAPNGSYFALLEHPEELRLETGRHLADLVEQQGSAVGFLEEPGPRRRGAREGAGDMSEELALQQRFRDARAVDGEEGAVGPRTLGVHGTRGQLLTGSALPLEQHGPVSACDATKVVEQSRHHVASADHSVEVRYAHRFTVPAQLVAQPPVLEYSGHTDREVVEVEWLGQEIVRPLLQRPHRLIYRAEGGDHDECRRLLHGPGPIQKRESVGAGKPQVADDQVDRLLREDLDCGLRGCGREDFRSVVLEFLPEQVAERGLVLDDQNPGGAAGHDSLPAETVSTDDSSGR